MFFIINCLQICIICVYTIDLIFFVCIDAGAVPGFKKGLNTVKCFSRCPRHHRCIILFDIDVYDFKVTFINFT